MKEYRFVEIPDPDTLRKSLQGPNVSLVPIQLREADKPDAPIERRGLILKSLHHDKQGENMWLFEGWLRKKGTENLSVIGMFIYPPKDKTQPASLIVVR